MTLSSETLAKLRAIDTPTVSNAVESFGVRPRTLGHTDASIECMFPEMGVALGYAVTFTTSEYAPGEERTHTSRIALYEAVAAAPRPASSCSRTSARNRARRASGGRSCRTSSRAWGRRAW